ncbi:MAG: AI-2E family transporter [Actinomycetota bacterium]
MDEHGAEPAPSSMPPWVRRAILYWWGVLVALWATYVVVRQVRGLLIQIVLALFLSFAMEPLVERLGRYGVRRGLATAFTMALTIVFFVVFFTAMGSLVAGQLQDLAEDLPGYISSAEEWAESRFDIEIENEDVLAQLSDGGRASEYISGLADNLLGVGTSLASILFQFLTISLFAFYFTADGPRLRQTICSVLPPARQHEVLRVWELAIAKTGAFISSRVILAIISSVVHWILFALLDLPSPIALAIWVGLISQFVPVIGIYIAGVVPALIAVGIDPAKALWVVIALVIYQQIENYGLQPRITAQTLNMHPAVAFAAVLAGTATFGATGALLALPFLATVQSFISAYIARHTVVESRLLGEAAPMPAQASESEDDEGQEG